MRRLSSDPARTEPIGGDYFEVVYGPLIGPTAVLLARSLVRHVEAANGDASIPVVQLALEVGVRASSSEPLGKGSPVARSLRRLSHHHLIIQLGDEVVGVAARVPLLSDRTVAKLPEAARRHHQLVLARRSTGDRPADEA